MTKNNNLRAIALVTSLFFIWGFALNMNPILIPHLKKACQLTDLQSSYVDSASYMAYFLLAIPAGQFMRRFGYKGGILLGLLLVAGGAFLLYPASAVRSYAFILLALFVLFSGSAFLETAANPYITVLGDPEGATQRINFSQSFNGLAAFLAPLVGGIFILSGKTLTPKQEHAMSAVQLNTYLNKEASAVQVPYLVIAVVVLSVAFLLYKTHVPEIHDDEEVGEKGKSLIQRIFELLDKRKQLRTGAFAEFFYVGAQAGVLSFFIRFSERIAGMEEKTAAYLLSLSLLGFMAGRFIGTALMRAINPVKLLAAYCVINIGLLMLSVSTHGSFSVYSLMCVAFFMSIMFPTIFSLGIRGLGSETKLGSSLLIMGIVGGAIIPPIMGKVSDLTSIRYAYLVPVISFAYILYFAYMNLKVKKLDIVGAH
ncbi:MAG TPA: L-fucose:H+ symporter permease [Mucilaginibacter sp.]|jgi:FHS family L-fucose permease-like MFS transporter|nr:L-fucose:H+ symporter permease [Mucilaginibacter sp.]